MWARALDSKSGFSYFNTVDKRLGWRRLALNFTPFPQHFKLFFAVLKLKRNSHFFKDKGKFFRSILLYFWSIWLAWLQNFQYHWCDFVSLQITPNDWCVRGETDSHEGHAPSICINELSGLIFLVITGIRVVVLVSLTTIANTFPCRFNIPQNSHFPCRTMTLFSFTMSTKIALIKLNLPIKDPITLSASRAKWYRWLHGSCGKTVSLNWLGYRVNLWLNEPLLLT